MSGWLLIVGGMALMALSILTGVATSSVRRVDLYRWAAHRQPGARAAASLLAAPEQIVRATKGLSTIGALSIGLGVAPLLVGVPVGLAAAATVLVAVPVVLLAAYAVPRALGRRWARSAVQRTVPIVRRLTAVFSPVRALPTDPAEGPELERGGPVADTEQELDELTVLSGVLAFTERPVREVMTPRTEIVATQEGTSVEEIVRLFIESGHSRIPLYRESLDDIIGMVYAFDLLKTAPGAELPVRPIATAPMFQRSAELLQEMQRDRRQIAVVLDEYGGTAGVVTFEDLLEELVGEIFDEHDGVVVSGASPVQLIEASGATPIEEISTAFAVVLPEAAQTLGGLLTRLAGHIPSKGERFQLAGLEFDVVAASPRK
ncbi:MAG: hemolysin family protein, partial [Gemmatimonadota bacterium]|nr:hemolysin family protein [Gemmatimonadota bacterium]